MRLRRGSNSRYPLCHRSEHTAQQRRAGQRHDHDTEDLRGGKNVSVSRDHPTGGDRRNTHGNVAVARGRLSCGLREEKTLPRGAIDSVIYASPIACRMKTIPKTA